MKIFVLMGKSASGKDSIYNKLLKSPFLMSKIEPLVLYTTRPKRSGEIDGVTYNFVSKNEFEDMWENNPRMLESRMYEVGNGKWWQYGTVLPNDVKGSYLTINTPRGVATMMQYISTVLEDEDPSLHVEIYPIMVETPGYLRLQRSLDRLLVPEDTDIKEICRRYLADERDFDWADYEVKEAMETFSNINNIEDTVYNIEQYILSKLQEGEKNGH